MTKTVLVTGATGFTGSHLSEELVRRGHRVRALVRPSSNLGRLKALGVEPYFADLADKEPPPEALRGVDIVYHVAAVYRQENLPKSYFYDVNVGGTNRLLRAAMAADVERFVHCSTVGVLGNVTEPLANEESPYSPHDHYQHSKMLSERMMLDYARQYDMPISIVRPGAIYGPGDMRFLKLFRAIDHRMFWMIGPGEVFYHLVYVSDLVDGLIRAGENPAAKGEVFIIAGEKPVKVRILIGEIARILGRQLHITRVPVQPVMLAAQMMNLAWKRLGWHRDPPLYPRRLDFFLMNRAFDISKAKQVLGYQPRTDLQRGLEETARWYRQNGYLQSA